MNESMAEKTAWDVTASALMPGGGIAKRPLHFLIAADCSWSMNGDKMQSLNYAIATMLPQLAAWERAQENAQVLVRAIRFDNRASWHIERPTPVAQIHWQPLRCEERALTHTGAALRLMASVLTADRLERRALRPALILVTDGIATDDFDSGLAELLATPGGAAAIRIAVAIGRDARPEQLAAFSDPTIPVLQAATAREIPDLLMAVSIAVSRVAEVGIDPTALTEELRKHGIV